MKENIKFQLRQLEDMAGENVELQKKVSQFVSDSLNELEELQIDPMYSTQLLSVLASGYSVITLTEDNAKWKMDKDGNLVHFLCKYVIKKDGKVYNKLGYVFFEPDSDKGFVDDLYSLKPLTLPCLATELNPTYLQLRYKVEDKSLKEQVKTLLDAKDAKDKEIEKLKKAGIV